MTPRELTNRCDDYYMLICQSTATQSPCLRTKVGAVLASGDHIITAYCGNSLCQGMGCIREHVKSGEALDNCIGTHAEQKVMINAGKEMCQDATLYVTHFPCAACARMIVYSGIRRVVYANDWGDMSMPKFILDTGYVTYHKFVSKEMGK